MSRQILEGESKVEHGICVVILSQLIIEMDISHSTYQSTVQRTYKALNVRLPCKVSHEQDLSCF